MLGSMLFSIYFLCLFVSMNSLSFHITKVVVVISIAEIHFFCTVYALSFCNDSTDQVISEVIQ